MDVQMPVMDGLETTHIIRDPASPVKNHAVPIIALTASSLREDRLCLQAGMNGFILKPMHSENMARALTAVLTGRTQSSFQPSPPLEEPVFNGKQLLDTLEGDEQMYAALLARVITDIQRHFFNIRSGFTEKDMKRIAFAAHAVHGICGNIQASEAASIASSIETSIKLREGAGLAQLIDKLDSAVHRLTASISLYLSRHSAEGKEATA